MLQQQHHHHPVASSMTPTITTTTTTTHSKKRKMPTSFLAMAAAAALCVSTTITTHTPTAHAFVPSHLPSITTSRCLIRPTPTTTTTSTHAHTHTPLSLAGAGRRRHGHAQVPLAPFSRLHAASNDDDDQQPISSSTLREEIREKFKSFFGGMANLVVPEEEGEGAGVGGNDMVYGEGEGVKEQQEAAAADSALNDAIVESLSKTKGGAGGPRGSSVATKSLVTPGSPSTTTISLVDVERTAAAYPPTMDADIDSRPCKNAITPSLMAKQQRQAHLQAKQAHKNKQSTIEPCLDHKPPQKPTLSSTAAALGKVPEPVNENIARISTKVPNSWLAICHSASLKPKELKKIWVDEKPICLFRTSTGEVKAISDICLHRAAALSDGWLEDDMVVCPYHAYKFDGDGKLRYIPGVDESMLAKNKRTARTVWYKTLEQGGLVYIFPDAMRAGAIEQHVKPFLIPEETDPTFRVVQGSAEIKAAANLVVENLLDMLHISYVHSFGNMQEPLPFSEAYDYMYDDEASQLLPYARTTFKYRAGPTSISKVVGKVQEVVVENEFHLPYTTVTRVRFGNDVKTIYVVAVPVNDNLTVVHYKLYRNFMYVHPRDESIVNKGLDEFFQQVMKLTLNEDKEILESLYEEHQAGYVLSRYDKPLKIYRKTMKEFQEASQARETIAERRTLEMELLRLIETSERGRKATRGQHATILSIVSALEKGFQKQYGGQGEDGQGLLIEDAAVNGTWHLVYANPGNLSAIPPQTTTTTTTTNSRTRTLQQETQAATAAAAAVAASASGSAFNPPPTNTQTNTLTNTQTRREVDDALITPLERSQRLEKRLRSAGGERYLLDFTEKQGRPVWADTEQSIQTIDTDKGFLSNTAVYQGLLGIKTKVELNAIFKKQSEKSNRKDVQFTTAQVDVGGFKVTFPHMDVFGVRGWLETTFCDEHIRICRGNRGSVFVLTRRPLAPVSRA